MKVQPVLRIKRAHSAALRDQVYSLRYRAYRKEDAIEANVSEAFEDQYDHQPNHILWVLTHHEKVIGSIRTTWFDPADHHVIPEMQVYSDDIVKAIPANARVISGNRLVTDPDLPSTNAQVVLLLLRHHMVVASHKTIEWAVAAARSNHLAFYRRVFRATIVSQSRLYPGLLCPMQLLASNFGELGEEIKQNTPLLRAHGYERMLLDPSYEDVWEKGLPVVAQS